MKHPARAEALCRLGELFRDVGQFFRRGAGRVLSAYLPGRQKGAVLLQDDPRIDERGIGQQIGQFCRPGAKAFEVKHHFTLNPPKGRQRLAFAL